MRERQYILEEVEFKGKAYQRIGRKVIKHNACGFLSLPKWMIGKEYDVILIPIGDQ